MRAGQLHGFCLKRSLITLVNVNHVHNLTSLRKHDCKQLTINETILISSSLPHVAEGEGYIRRRPKAFARKLYSKGTRQTKPEINILSAVCRVLN